MCEYRFGGCNRLANSSGGEPKTLTQMHMLRGVLLQKNKQLKVWKKQTRLSDTPREGTGDEKA